jgi:hypothetical protein
MLAQSFLELFEEDKIALAASITGQIATLNGSIIGMIQSLRCVLCLGGDNQYNCTINTVTAVDASSQVLNYIDGLKTDTYSGTSAILITYI